MTRAAKTVLVVAITVVTAGCGGGSPAARPQPSASGQGCAPIAGKQLVVLDDDKKLQTVNNILPVVNTHAATPDLLSTLDKASALLTPERLLALNRATDVEGKTSQAAAQAFASATNLTRNMPRAHDGGRIIIGSTNFSESQTLGFVYQIALNAAGYDATVQPVGNRESYEPALEKGEIQVVPEYTGTLTEFLNRKANGTNASSLASGDLDKTVAALGGLGNRFGLTFGKPAPASAQNAFAVTRALADRYSLKTLSDFAAKCSGDAAVLAGPPECPNSSFCQPGLQKRYGITFGRFASLDAGGPRSKAALTAGTATMALVFSSDAALAG
jgi:osmoprotectant transport system substrate-binding protein